MTDDWQMDAACLEIDPDLFFSENWHDVEKAKEF